MASPDHSERDPLEMLAAEFMERLRQGQRPSVEEYAVQHPELAEEIRGLFPTIAVTERLKARQEQTSGGRATLGAAQLSRLGDFRIIREIGRGGMGVVFEAEQESLKRRVAVKVLPRQALLDEKHLKRFQREARIAANLHHTNIVEVFGVGEQDGFHYYVMQLIEGFGLDVVVPALSKVINASAKNEAASVSPALENGGLISTVRQLLGEEGFERQCLFSTYWQNVARIGLQAADALSYAHSQGVLHRDIKPANLLLTPQGAVWLTDFGLAKAAQSDDLSLSRDFVGTLRYMPPEQFRGQTDHRSDIYSLGLTLYELLALRPAYDESDQSKLMQRIMESSAVSPGIVRAGIPRDLETIVLKAISHEADGRYQSAAEMADDLRCFLEDHPIRARRVSAVEHLSRWCHRNKALAGLAGTTLLLLVLVAVVASIGYVRTKTALHGEAQQRAKAEANASLAIEALDRAFDRLCPMRITIRQEPTVEGLRGATVDMPVTPIVSRETGTLLEEMLPLYDRLAQQTGNDDGLRLRTAEASRRVGTIRQRLGQSAEALQAYQRASALYQELNSRPHPNADFALKLAQVQNELGRLFTSQRKSAEARQAHLAALKLLQTNAAQPDAPPEKTFELARTCFFLGLREQPLPMATPPENNNPEPIPPEQRDSLAKAVALLKTLSASNPANPEYPHLLALCYQEGAAVEDNSGPDANAGDEQAIAILQNLVNLFPDNPDYAYDLSEVCARIHIPPAPIPREVESDINERFDRSLALLKKLVSKYPEVPDFLAAEARIHDKLGAFHRQMDHWAEAEQSFRQAIALQRELVIQFADTPYYGLWLATFRINLADAQLHQNQPGAARTELESTISDLLKLVEQTPGMYRPYDLLASAYSNLEMALRQTGEENLADAAARKAEQERSAARLSR